MGEFRDGAGVANVVGSLGTRWTQASQTPAAASAASKLRSVAPSTSSVRAVAGAMRCRRFLWTTTRHSKTDVATTTPDAAIRYVFSSIDRKRITAPWRVNHLSTAPIKTALPRQARNIETPASTSQASRVTHFRF